VKIRKQSLPILIILIQFLTAETYSQDFSGSFVFEGRMRTYDVYLPDNYKPNMPLVLNLHGSGVGKGKQASYTSMHEYADEYGFIIVYPEGSMGSEINWNNGVIDPEYITDSTANDIGFISALIDTIDSKYDIDLNRIYSCGWSMGGIMTHRLAIELGHRFAAVASVAGKLNTVIGNIGKPIRAFPLIYINGTADFMQYYYFRGRGNSWSVQETLNFWIENNDCLTEPDTISLPDLNPSDGCTVEKISYTNCADNGKLIHFKILNGGHGWPGGDSLMYPYSSPHNMDINANEEILGFFNEYNNPLVNIAYAKSIDVFPKTVSAQGDTIIVKSSLNNTDNHLVKMHAFIQDISSTFKDTLQLYDDGLHGDGAASDYIYGVKKWFSVLDKEIYEVRLRLIDQDAEKTTYLNHPTYFTTNGPVTLDRHEITDIQPNYTYLKITLRNDGQDNAVNNVSATLSTNDSIVTYIRANSQNFGNINPGNIIESKTYYVLTSTVWDSIKFDIYILSEGHLLWHEDFTIYNKPDRIEDLQEIPMRFKLDQNYPNPFNPSTKIGFTLPKSANVKIEVYNIQGQKIKILIDGKMPPGNHRVEFNSQNLSSGVYYYSIEADGFQDVKKMILLR
jgi:polyhydroxybutyrate depolymerase